MRHMGGKWGHARTTARSSSQPQGIHHEEDSDDNDEEEEEEEQISQQQVQQQQQYLQSDEPYEREMNAQFEAYYEQNPFLTLPDSQPDSNMIIDEEATARYPSLHSQENHTISEEQTTEQQADLLVQPNSEQPHMTHTSDTDLVDLDDYLQDSSSDLSPIPFPQTQSQSQSQ